MSRNSTKESDDELGRGDMEIIEEESESEPEIECEIWDNDCRIVNIRIENCLIGYHLMPTCMRNPDENPRKRIKLSPEIRSELANNGFVDQFQISWNDNEKFLKDNVELIVNPFKVCVIQHFLSNTELLNELRQEFNEIDWNMRHMDLYEFFQSQDLKNLTNFRYLQMFYDFLKTDVMQWLKTITKYDLTHISATCSCYTNTDYLLVHDDQRDDRMVAFIFYLTNSDEWTTEKGGELQILTSDDKGHPSNTVRDIYPSDNQFVFFPVTNNSYHQVGEILTKNDYRLSINGWFHIKTPQIFQTPNFTPYRHGLYSKESFKRATKIDLELASWINDEYLNCEIINEIQQYFEGNSEICLRNFLKSECFNEIATILQNSDLNWVRIGPPNRYNYEVLNIENLPQVLERLLGLFQSRQMFSLLQRFTDLDLGTKKASMRFELQRWQPGCYSLLTDYDWQKKELDLLLFFGCKNNSDVIGARTQYVTIDDEIQNALITIDPEENNLNIIYRDTARFTKYFSKQSRCKCFYLLICSYNE